MATDPISPEHLAMLERGETPEGWIVCRSRCLYCGRQTPHEVCHEHHRIPKDVDPDALWSTGADLPPEQCALSDDDCYAALEAAK